MVLKINHNQGGFFSCSTVALCDIIRFLNEHGYLPHVDRSEQYKLQRNENDGDVSEEFFDVEEGEQKYPSIQLNTDYMDIQWLNYKELPFDLLDPIIQKYFKINPNISCDYYETLSDIHNWKIGVIYRGLDKGREIQTPSYEMFFEKIDEICEKTEGKIFCLPDERAFERSMKKRYGSRVVFPLLPSTDKKHSNNFYELPQNQRKNHAKEFLYAMYVASNLEHLITHSGNVGLWSALYRGNGINVHQALKDKWL